MVMNIIIPDEGSIKVLEQKMDEEMKERIGYLPEDRGLYPKMKVGELLVFLAELKGLRGSQARKEIDFWLEWCDLSDWKVKKALARALYGNPKLIILDEPFSGLDPVNTKLLKDIILEMKEKGGTIVFSTHRMEQVEMICDDICLINKAEMVLEGNLSQIKKQYGKNTVVLDYDGDASFIQNFPEVEKIDDYGKFMEIKLREKSDPQALLQNLVGKIAINKYEIQEPSLNAIFIEKVGGKGVRDEENTVGH